MFSQDFVRSSGSYGRAQKYFPVVNNMRKFRALKNIEETF